MVDPKLILLVVFVASGSALVALSVPLIRRRVPPNPLYGFRVKRTMENTSIWYAVNRYATWRLLWLGATLLAVATALYFVAGVSFIAYAAVCLTLLLCGLAFGMFQSFRYLRRCDTAVAQSPER